MPRVTVIDYNDRRILLHDGTAVRAIPSDPYHSLKYGAFDGNRIFHAFGGDRRLRIEETYNDGIFNAYRTPDGAGGNGVRAAEQVVQISDALGLARAVLADDGAAYDAMFAEWYGRKMQADIVEYMIVAGNSDRVATVQIDGKIGSGGKPADIEKAYIVDGRFMVDGRGAAYYRAEEPDEDDDDYGDGGPPAIAWEGTATDGHGTQFHTQMGDWEYLCLVADDGRRNNGGGGGAHIVDVPGKGTAEMSSVTRVVVAKIAFLLHPSSDTVFLNQLPAAMRKKVRRMIRDREAY